MALTRYARIRSRNDSRLPSSGHAPTRVWYSRYSSFGSGPITPPIAALYLRFVVRHLVTAVFHAPGISDNTLSRARTSSPRFVSWVEVADNAHGHRLRRSDIHTWTSAGLFPKRVGSPPTSFRDNRRLYR